MNKNIQRLQNKMWPQLSLILLSPEPRSFYGNFCDIQSKQSVAKYFLL